MIPLVFRGRLTEADVADMWSCYNRVLIRPWIMRLGRPVAILLAIYLAWHIAIYGPSRSVISPLLACISVPFITPYLRIWKGRWHYRRHSSEYLESKSRIDAGGGVAD